MSAPTACKHTVSGSISLPCSGFFSPFPHGTSSLSVSQEYLALPDGAGGFPQGVSDPAVLRILHGWLPLRIRGCHTLWPGFPSRSTSVRQCQTAVLQPRACRNMPGLGSSPFARHYSGNHCYFLFLRLLRCFSSARSPPGKQIPGWYRFTVPGSPIRKSPDRIACADHRGLSQLVTSFIASGSLGIPRVPFITFFSPYPFALYGDAFWSGIRTQKP